MAKRRVLKRTITNICSELFIEGVAASFNNKHPENSEALLSSILKMEREFVCRISHVEPGMKARTYFKDLSEKFNARVIELVDQINYH